MKEKKIVGVIVKSKFITHTSDKFNSYINYEVAKEKAKNNLNGYIYEIMIRGEKWKR